VTKIPAPSHTVVDSRRPGSSLLNQLSQSKIQYFDQTVTTEHDILRLDVAVNDSRLVRGLEC
jgi:hypothetical protein